MALPNVTEELWTEDSYRVLDQFIADTTITTLVVYVDTEAKLQVELSIPLPVQLMFPLHFYSSNTILIIIPDSFPKLFIQSTSVLFLTTFFFPKI